MKESTKKLLKTLGAMGFCAILSGAAGKGVDIAKDKFVNSDAKPDDDGHTPTEEEIAELAKECPENVNSDESMIEESIKEVEEEKED
jgi:hypothetical protein